MVDRRRSERGNVFFIILIGVVLFAAVSAAIVGTTRGGKSISDEKSRMLAGEILRYAGQIKNAANYLYQNGVSETDIRFSHPKLDSGDYGDITVNPTYQVFAEQGGGLPYASPNPEAFKNATVPEWEFAGSAAIANVGSAESDLIVMAVDLKDNVCQQINALIGQAATTPAVTVDCPYNGNASFAGTFQAVGGGQLVVAAPWSGVSALQACVACSAPYGNVYFNVLIER